MLHKADRVLRKLTENESTNIFSDRRILSYGERKKNFQFYLNLMFLLNPQ